MFTPEQYREKAGAYSELAKQGNAPNEVREFQKHKQSFTMLADNEQWLADNHDNLAINLDKLVPLPEPTETSAATFAAEEERILRCLGAALILQWNTLPPRLQRELFHNADPRGQL